MKKLIFALVMTMVFAFAATSFAFTQYSISHLYGANVTLGNSGHDVATAHNNYECNENTVDIVRQNVVDNKTVTKHTDEVYYHNYQNTGFAGASTDNKTLNVIYGNNGNDSAHIYNNGSHNKNNIRINRTNLIDNSVTNEYIRKK